MDPRTHGDCDYAKEVSNSIDKAVFSGLNEWIDKPGPNWSLISDYTDSRLECEAAMSKSKGILGLPGPRVIPDSVPMLALAVRFATREEPYGHFLNERHGAFYQQLIATTRSVGMTEEDVRAVMESRWPGGLSVFLKGFPNLFTATSDESGVVLCSAAEVLQAARLFSSSATVSSESIRQSVFSTYSRVALITFRLDLGERVPTLTFTVPLAQQVKLSLADAIRGRFGLVELGEIAVQLVEGSRGGAEVIVSTYPGRFPPAADWDYALALDYAQFVLNEISIKSNSMKFKIRGSDLAHGLGDVSLTVMPTISSHPARPCEKEAYFLKVMENSGLEI